jgi:hypothetical protein
MMNYKLITASGSFKVPANCTMLKLGISVATGGGGGGGSSGSSNINVGNTAGFAGGSGGGGGGGRKLAQKGLAELVEFSWRWISSSNFAFNNQYGKLDWRSWKCYRRRSERRWTRWKYP